MKALQLPLARVPFNAISRSIEAEQEAIDTAITRVLASGRLILGEENAAFEAEFAAYCGVPYCVATANGTDALELALRALDCGSGDEVVTAPNAGGYATTAIVLVGAIPVFADVDPGTLTLSPDALREVLGPKVKA